MDLFRRMRAGEFPDGSRVLRAKIDMASPNLNMRDPVIYRILRVPHHRTGDKWCIYPMYDFAHPLSDALEKITHSICTLEFEDHRPLYDWFIEQLPVPRAPQQIEFARLNLTYTMMSKRKLLQLVERGIVQGWDDPRMPTIAGLRRRGYTPAAIRDFCERIGVAKSNSMVDIALLEHCLREDLNKHAPRVMGVLRPLKVVIENYPEGQVEEMEAVNNPEDPTMGVRKVPFSKVLYIEEDDFMEDPPKKFYRLAPGREVRLRYGYFIKCTDVIKDEAGQIVELRCTYDPETKGGSAPDGRKVKATLHWVSAAHAVPAEVRLYEHLYREDPVRLRISRNVSTPVRLRFYPPRWLNPFSARRHREAATSLSGWVISVLIPIPPLRNWCLTGRSRSVILGRRFKRNKTSSSSWSTLAHVKRRKLFSIQSLPGLNCISFFRRISWRILKFSSV